MQRKPWKKLVLVAVVLAIIGLILHGWFGGRGSKLSTPKQAATVPVRVAVATRGDLDLSLKVIGSAEAYSTVNVQSRVNGQLLSLSFKPGGRVRQGETIIGGLRAAAGRFPFVKAVRGKGLMFAIELADPATGEPSPPLAGRMMEATRERGLLVGKGGLYGNVIRMAPPLTLTDAEAAEGLGILIDSLESLTR